MPLAELSTYQGRNPKPDDFEQFWDAGLAEMHAVDPQVQMTPHDFKQNLADCYES